MSYCTREQVLRLVGPENFRQMLDDDQDGVEDAGLFDALAVDASDAVDAYLGAQYDVPFSGSAPAFARLCAKIICAEMLYQRRGIARDANPWTKQADTLRTRLEKIAAGDDQLDMGKDEDGEGIEVQSEPSRFAQAGNTMMF